MVLMTSPAELVRIVNHVFLLPKSPQKEEEPCDIPLMDMVLQGLNRFRSLLPEQSNAIEKSAKALANLRAVNNLEGGATNETELRRIMSGLSDGETLAIKVGAQNAGIMITRAKDEVWFEEFELSPQNSDVIQTKCRLLRSFPGLAVAVDAVEVNKEDFWETIAYTVFRMSSEMAPGMRPKSKKAGHLHDEERDTTHPGLVSELLVGGILRGVGHTVTLSSISKKTREEVFWNDSGSPWRRSSMWLLIRVMLQLIISRSPGGSPFLYKVAMVFIMSHIHESSLYIPLATDMLYAMSAKIARRLHKLESSTESGIETDNNTVISSVYKTLSESSLYLKSVWLRIQRNDVRERHRISLKSLADFDFAKDSMVSIPPLDKYIQVIKSYNADSINESFSPSSQLIGHEPAALPTLPDSISGDYHYAAANLQQFEQWVAMHLEQWLTSCDNIGAIKNLHEMLMQYHGLAQNLYKHNPEGISVMLLTIYELWVACDVVGTRACSLLQNYDPGIPDEILPSLLLVFKDQMERLQGVETYLNRRKANSRFTATHLFKLNLEDGFSVQYFNSSPAHQALYSRILVKAEKDKQAKIDEIQIKKAEYARLKYLAEHTSHEYVTVVTDSWGSYREMEQRHKGNCQSCEYDRRAANLSIKVHEWPLPTSINEAKGVIFELQVPSWYADWRDARLYLLHDVLSGTMPERRPQWLGPLCDDPHLRHLWFRERRHRLGLLSECKPNVSTHFRDKAISTTSQDEVCLRNGLMYQYYDTTGGRFLGDFTFTEKMPHACVYALPNHCKLLQRYLFRPASKPDGIPPNDAIAGQDNCPQNMTLDEYKELTLVPFGRHLQWSNVLLQLVMPELDLKKTETYFTILQCIYQSGPRGSDMFRETHADCKDRNFATKMIQKLHEALNRVKENWDSGQALSLLIDISTRILSLNDSVRDICLDFLRQARSIASSWIDKLTHRAQDAVNASDRSTYISKSVEVALICGNTFDLDKDDLNAVLSCSTAVSILIKCSIVEQRGWSISMERSDLWRMIRLRFKRLLYRAYRILPDNQAGIHYAIQKAWSAYTPSHGWTIVSQNWLTTSTSLSGTNATMSVHYNLLSGELLVNGLPLDRLPQQYLNHPMFQVLFGTGIVEVMPTTSIPGFSFSALRQFGGFTVYLGMDSSNDQKSNHLRVRATNGVKTYETVPSHLFATDYPTYYVEGHIHWYVFENDTIQFRAAHMPWNAESVSNWTLFMPLNDSQWRLDNGQSSVLGLKSETARALSTVFYPLAESAQIYSISRSHNLDIHIPNLQLGFSITQGTSQLRSKQFRSMEVDSDQSLGTLVGLQNKLLLKSSSGDARLLLIPEGQVTYRRHSAHIIVEILRKSVAKVHTFDIDTNLGRLIDNGKINCKLFLAYLHALTSYCLADPFTLKTGTEQALAILSSAAVRSFDQLSQNEVNRLAQISRLTPGRAYYPPHMRVMQRVSWDPQLSFLSQHGHFHRAVSEIFEQAQKTAIFYPGSSLQFPRLDFVDGHLDYRDRIRSSVFRTFGFGAEDYTIAGDKIYEAKDHEQLSQRAKNAALISSLVHRTENVTSLPAGASGHLWGLIQIAKNVNGPHFAIEKHCFRYNPELISGWKAFLANNLPAIHVWLRKKDHVQKYRFSLLAWLSTMAFSKTADLQILQVLAIIMKTDFVSHTHAPDVDNFTPNCGRHCTAAGLRSVVAPHVVDFSSSPENDLTRRANEPRTTFNNRRHSTFQSNSNAAVSKFVNALSAQWRCRRPSTPETPTPPHISTYIHINPAMNDVIKKFESWDNNSLLSEYLTSIEETVSSLNYKPVTLPELDLQSPTVKPTGIGFVSTEDMFSGPAPQLPRYSKINDIAVSINENQKVPIDSRSFRLGSFIKSLKRVSGESEYEQKYTKDLEDSLLALAETDDRDEECVPRTLTLESLMVHLEQCEKYVDYLYQMIVGALESNIKTRAVQVVQQFPRVSPTLVLQQMSRHRWRTLPNQWRTCIVGYGVALTSLQRAQRLVQLSRRQVNLTREIRNTGHKNWNPLQYPESLLIEVESGIMIRDVQEQVAAEMRAPRHNRNSTMQLNMGEGKTSLIVPIVAAALADGSQLVRIIVAKPQSKQMAQILMAKLGGLVNRRIYYMPCSRDLRLDESGASTVASLIKECRTGGGILLVQPEHILSLQLMVPESRINGRDNIGRLLLETLDFFNKFARDIVDESDENFNVRFELIYTMGAQRSVEYSPDRWTLFQKVFDLVRDIISSIAGEFPQSIEIQHPVPGSFPRVRLLRQDAQASMVHQIACRICEQSLEGLPISRLMPSARRAVYQYITEFNLNNDVTDAVTNSDIWGDSFKPLLLLLRGLLADGILVYVLSQKRWRVNYGLAVRTPPTRLAVPYRARDFPTPRSEFSHPEVVIAVTLLSYYYSGLSDDDLFATFEHLIKSDVGDLEYQIWLRDADSISLGFRQLQSINLKDKHQCVTDLFPRLRHGKSVIDYFLSHIVFPKEMKEFPTKLSASGWDIGKIKGHVLTGFSGTCDSRHLLPLDVHHLDLKPQQHTNALVLEHLLQPQNSVHCMQKPTGGVSSSDAEQILSAVIRLEPTVQVILDVGAQVLELTNLDFAKAWLKRYDDSSKEAVVFVNDADELCVVDRAHREDLLQTSPFSTRLDACLVFLDEAHTRGIDLKLPIYYRAAVTLGSNITKDRLVQACMRMRGLGKGQTVVFCVSEEIRNSIWERTSKAVGAAIELEDVVLWAISETHTEIRRSMPLWVVQGKRFVRQEEIWDAIRTTNSERGFERLLEDEAQSIESRYKPRENHQPLHTLLDLTTYNGKRIATRYQQFDSIQSSSNSRQEEQVRELSPEIQQERQVQKPPPASAEVHRLHADVIRFAKTGEILPDSSAYVRAFSSLNDTSLSQYFDLSQFKGSGRLLATADFVKTVKKSFISGEYDVFQRPVRWVITNFSGSSTTVGYILIVSPHEANQLYPTMKTVTATTLHLYKPRCNCAYATLDMLGLHMVPFRTETPSVPRALIVQLNLFAGQLYISSYDDYLETCKFLGLKSGAISVEMKEAGWEVGMDGFIKCDGNGQVGGESGMRQSPVNVMQTLMSKIRRSGESINKTHMGSLLRGKGFEPADFCDDE